MPTPPRWSNRARAQLRAIAQDQALEILKSIAQYLTDGSGDVTALSGALAGRLRLRCGNYPVIFSQLLDGRILIHNVAHRRDVYRVN